MKSFQIARKVSFRADCSSVFPFLLPYFYGKLTCLCCRFTSQTYANLRFNDVTNTFNSKSLIQELYTEKFQANKMLAMYSVILCWKCLNRSLHQMSQKLQPSWLNAEICLRVWLCWFFVDSKPKVPSGVSLYNPSALRDPLLCKTHVGPISSDRRPLEIEAWGPAFFLGKVTYSLKSVCILFVIWGSIASRTGQGLRLS